MSRVVVIGGGAAGMMAAIAAAKNAESVTLLEKNEKLGKKLYLTGKGRCNLTNDTDTDGLLFHVAHNPKFLYSAFSALDASDTKRFFERENLPLKTERGNRVFPLSDKSSDVIRTLEKTLRRFGVTVRLNTKADALCVKEKRCVGVNVSGKILPADAVIVACGGLSYPQTGSTGDGFTLAKAVGHTVQSPFPSLVPLTVKESYIAAMQGLTLKNVVLTVKKNQGDKKFLFSSQGELLFTHFGVSGPLGLLASSFLSGNKPPFFAGLDIKPALDKDRLEQRLLRDFTEFGRMQCKNYAKKLLPAKMAPVLLDFCQISPQKLAGQITKKERERLISALKAFPFTVTGLRGFDEAVITRGGVSVNEVNPATMESKRVKGLYFAGEVLDVDAFTGGYNLQIAWSTGNLAGLSASAR